LEYFNHLNKRQLKASSKIDRLVVLKLFFETGVVNKWFQVPSYLIRSEDLPKKVKSLPRYIPEEVMQQLNQHLDALPEPVMRMVLVIQECGLRIGELLELPINCLKPDAKGDWYIQFRRGKILKEDTLPISRELAVVIQEQQQYIRQELGEGFRYLFCARQSNSWRNENNFLPQPRVMSINSFVDFLKRLAREFDIRDNSGKCWNFQTHQFRHTVGTRMINNGVPQHIVQRYLGHESPTMTAVYAYIHDQTLKKEIAKYHDSRVVNITGAVVKSDNPELEHDADLQWFRKKVLAQALPNGYCSLPMGASCLKANACLTCGDFRTTKEFLSLHKEQLERTQEILEKARANEWERQVQINEDVK